MPNDESWAQQLDEEFEILMNEMAKLEVSLAAFMLNLYRDDAIVSYTQISWDELCRMNNEVEQRLERWRESQKDKAPEGIVLESLETAVKASEARARVLMDIRFAQFPLTRDRRNKHQPG